MMNTVHGGEPHAGNPHARIHEGTDGAPMKPTCSSLRYNTMLCSIRRMLAGIAASLSFCMMADTQKVGDYTWSYTIADGKATIECGGDGRSVEPSPVGAVAIPSVLGGCPVTSIGDWAFEDCSSLTSVTIPEGVTSIGDWAFGECSALVSVTIPEGVTNIGERAFKYCSALASVTIPSSVTGIGESAFEDCFSLASVTIPPSVVYIGDCAFDACYSLDTVYVGRGDASRVRRLLEDAGCDVTGVEFAEFVEEPGIAGDEGAVVTGDPVNGYVVRPSAGVEEVRVLIPVELEPQKVTVVVTTAVKSISTGGAKVSVLSGAYDITHYLDLPDTCFIDLAGVAVKDSVAKEALAGEGALVVLNPANPVIRTAATKPGLVYYFREGRTLGEVSGESPVAATKAGDGQPWMPPITVKGGDSAFYSIRVGK